MSYGSPRSRRRQKRSDPMMVFLAVITVAALPALGFAAYKLLNKPPTVIVTTEHVKAPIAKIEIKPKKKAEPLPDLDGGAIAKGPTRMAGEAVGKIAKQVHEAVVDLEKKALVIWLFDESASNDLPRSDVVAHIDDLYKGLDQGGPSDKKADAKDSPVLSVVAKYGPKIDFLTAEPTADLAEVRKAAEGIKSDSSPIEMTFTAIQTAAEKFSSYRLQGRVLFMIVVTDEVGNDEQKIDTVLPILKRYAIPVYCIGTEAPFSQIEGFNRGAEGSGADKSEIRVQQGPESRYAEWIRLDYPDGPGDTMGNIETGLGPYCLTRLCEQTDGEYFAAPQGAGGGFNSGYFGSGNRTTPSVHGLPRAYVPIYRSEAENKAELDKNKALRALVEAAKLPRVEVLRDTSASLTATEDAEKVREIDRLQRPSAKIILPLRAMYEVLKAGEADAAKLSEPRTRAAYWLAFGRASAALARAEGFNTLLGTAKGSPPKLSDPSHHAVLEASDEPTKISVTDKMASTARDLLHRVVKEFPGTPWAESAERELRAPIGWKWTER